MASVLVDKNSDMYQQKSSNSTDADGTGSSNHLRNAGHWSEMDLQRLEDRHNFIPTVLSNFSPDHYIQSGMCRHFSVKTWDLETLHAYEAHMDVVMGLKCTEIPVKHGTNGTYIRKTFRKIELNKLYYI